MKRRKSIKDLLLGRTETVLLTHKEDLDKWLTNAISQLRYCVHLWLNMLQNTPTHKYLYLFLVNC